MLIFFTGLQAKIKKLLNLHTPDDVDQDLYLEEISTHRKYSMYVNLIQR